MLKPASDKITAETREKLLALAEFIESDEQHGFFMGTVSVGVPGVFGHGLGQSDKPECGTAGCLAGHVGFMLGRNNSIRDWMCTGMAGHYLGLSDEQAQDLFYPVEGGWISSNDRTKAVRVLRHFAYTGEVDWRV